MKKPLLIALLFISTVFIACADGRKTTRKKATTKSSTSASLRGLTSVTMRRGACFGRCPEYTITINSSGLAEYSGIRNTTPLGLYQKNIGTARAQEMLRQFMENRADTCSTLYTARIADIPGLYYTLVINGKTKMINNAHFGPRYLVDLSEEMDELGKVDNTWKKIRDAAE